MSHSKRNTSLAYFTSHERSLLRSNWGTQSTRLTRESFLPFGYCRLCLGHAREPVACPGEEGVRNGGDKAKVHLFCKECALNDLMAQRKEIKRLERENEVRGREEHEDQAREEEERRRAELERFERNELGFEDGSNDSAGKKRKREAEEIHSRRVEDGADGSTSKKPRSSESSFWIPSSSTATTPSSIKHKSKLHPLCPGSSPTTPHTYSLKSLIPITFSDPDSTSTGDESSRICPSCKKALTNTSRPMLGTAPGCGHVICGTCADLFLGGGGGGASKNKNGPAKQNGEGGFAERINCFVCEADLSGLSHNGDEANGDDEGKKKAGKKEKEREKISRVGRLVEISCEGTGFAGGGANMAKREGVAFQC